MSFLDKQSDLLKITSRNFFLLSAFLIVLKKLNIIKTSPFVEENILFFLLFLSFFFYLFIFIRKNEKKYKEKAVPIFKYLFLFGLLLITISSLNFEFVKENEILNSITTFLSSINLYLSFFTIAFGFFTFYFNRFVILSESEKSQELEEFAEEKRKQEFEKKNHKWKPKKPKFNSFKNTVISIFYLPCYLFWVISYKLIRWIYKEGWTSVILIIVILVSGYFSFTYIGNHSFAQDEMHTVWPALNILEGAGPLNLEGDDRALSFPMVELTAFSFKIFGISEFSARFFNVIFFLCSLITIYFIGKSLVNKEIAILAMFISAFNTINFAEILELKIYALFQLLFLLGIYSIHQWEKSGWNIKSPWLYLFIINILIGIRTHVGYISFPIIGILYIAYSFSQIKKSIVPTIKTHNIIIFITILFSVTVYFLLFSERIIYILTASIKYLIGRWGEPATNVESFAFYSQVFLERTPLLIILLVPSLVILLYRYKRTGLYLSLFFIIPFITQNFFILRKATRYVTYFLPIFFLVSVVTVGLIVPVFKKSTQNKTINQGLTMFLIILLGLTITPPTKTYNVVTDPMATGGDSVILKTHYLWQDVQKYLEKNMEKDDIIIANLHEFGRTAYYLPNPKHKLGCKETGSGKKNIINNHTPAINNLHNAENLQYKIIKDIEVLEQIIQNNNGWFIIKKLRFEQQNLCTEDMLNYVRNNINLEREIRGIQLYKFNQ